MLHGCKLKSRLVCLGLEKMSNVPCLLLPCPSKKFGMTFLQLQLCLGNLLCQALKDHPLAQGCESHSPQGNLRSYTVSLWRSHACIGCRFFVF